MKYNWRAAGAARDRIPGILPLLELPHESPICAIRHTARGRRQAAGICRSGAGSEGEGFVKNEDIRKALQVDRKKAVRIGAGLTLKGWLRPEDRLKGRRYVPVR